MAILRVSKHINSNHITMLVVRRYFDKIERLREEDKYVVYMVSNEEIPIGIDSEVVLTLSEGPLGIPVVVSHEIFTL